MRRFINIDWSNRRELQYAARNAYKGCERKEGDKKRWLGQKKLEILLF